MAWKCPSCNSVNGDPVTECSCGKGWRCPSCGRIDATPVRECDCGYGKRHLPGNLKWEGKVRFLRGRVKRSIAARFVGKGNISITETQLIAEGKQLLPLGVQVALFLALGFLAMLVGFGPTGFLLAFLIDIFARTKESLTVEQATVKQVVADSNNSRFLLVFDATGGKSTNVVFQTLTDAAPLYASLRDLFKNSFQDGKVKGRKTI